MSQPHIDENINSSKDPNYSNNTNCSIQPILFSISGITARSPTRIRGYWTGYLHWSPRHGNTTSEPAGLRWWETGSFKLKNIKIGWVVPAATDLTVQPCFVREARGLGRPTLGKGEDTRRKSGIANNL